MTPPRHSDDADTPSVDAMPANLPAPPAEARQLSAKLIGKLREQIEQHGPLRFDEFMQQALYAPGLGYYTNGSDKIGREGDFVTAPEISGLFARCVSRLAQDVIQSGAVDILEVGGGRGALAAGVLEQLARQGCLPDNYYLLDISPDLRHTQQQTLQQQVPAVTDRVQWLDALPRQFNGLVIANEVLDAFAVRRFHRRGERNYEQYVDWCASMLCYRDVPLDEQRLQTRLGDLALPADYLSEVNFQGEDWVRTLGEHLERGVILLVDYGFPRREYYHPQRREGTLMCHYQHHAHPDPLILVGLQDITAHVDFTAMADAALSVGLEVSGYTTQAHFLLNSGVLEGIEADAGLSGEQRMQLANEIKRLTLPQEMGEMFKVMALSRQWDTMLPGFQRHDLRSHL